MSYLTKQEVLKRINGNPDCAAEFLLCNYEISVEDQTWAVEEANRSFKLHKLPMLVQDICISDQEILWKIKDITAKTVALSLVA